MKFYPAFLACLLLAGICAAEPACILYLTGVGCPHCARVDPSVLGDLPLEEDVVVIEYEIWNAPENREVFGRYPEKFWADRGVPQLVFGPGDYVVGDKQILEALPGLAGRVGGECLLLDGPESFSEADLSSLPGSPKIWFKDRVLSKTGNESVGDEVLKAVLFSDDPLGALSALDGVDWVSPEPVGLSGSRVVFPAAARFGGWLFQWNSGAPRSGGDRLEWTSIFMYVTITMEPLMKYLLGFALLVYVYILVQEKRASRRAG
ncbi:MAG: hypothetical protein ABH834_02490 [Candidatus Altiarchaeota archaeon]